MMNDREKIQILNDCPLCGSSLILSLGSIMHDKDQVYSGKKLGFNYQSELIKCRRCNSNFVSPRLSVEFSLKFYNESPASRWQLDSKNDDGNIDLELLYEKYTPTKFREVMNDYIIGKNYKNVLDIGCYKGKLLDIFRYYNLKTYGIDLNSDAVDIAKRNHQVLVGDIQRIDDFDMKFDIITAFDVIEHIYDIDNFWVTITEKLNKGGLGIFLTGNPNALGAKIMKNKWWYFKYPEHIIFPSLQYYTMIQNKYHFEIVNVYHVHHRNKYKLPFTDHLLIVIRK